MDAILFEVIKLAVMLVVGFLVGALAHLRTKYGKEFDEVYAWATVAVQWAQQVYWAESGAQRKTVVVNFMKDLRDKHKIRLTDEQIEVLVEAAVKQMNAADGIGYLDVGAEDVDDGDAGTAN